MLSREKLITELEKISTKENEYLIHEYIETIKGFSEEELAKQLNEMGIRSVRHIKSFVKKRLKLKHKFTKVNDLVSYGITGKTLHIHVVPKDLHGMLARRKEGLAEGELKLIDALEQIREMLARDEKLKRIAKVYAVSNIIRKPISRFFENLDFEVKSMRIEEAKTDDELKKFYDRFKDGKYLGRAQISKEKILSEEWSELARERKEVLQKELGCKFIEALKQQVNTEVSNEEVKRATDEPPKREHQDKIEEIE